MLKIILPFSGVSLTAGPSDIALSVLLVPGELSIIACAIFQLEKAFQVQVILPLTLERASVRVIGDTKTMSIVCFEAAFIDRSIMKNLTTMAIHKIVEPASLIEGPVAEVLPSITVSLSKLVHLAFVGESLVTELVIDHAENPFNLFLRWIRLPLEFS